MSGLRTETLDALLAGIGEEAVNAIISEFSCELNPEVEGFLRNKAIQAQRLATAVTYLVFRDTDLAGYFTLLSKPFLFPVQKLSGGNRRLAKRFAKIDPDTGNCMVSAYLIAQIGKNFSLGGRRGISGIELLELALDVLREVQARIGGKLVVVERDVAQPKLREFYERCGFSSWNMRKDDSDGNTYDQMLRVLDRLV